MNCNEAVLFLHQEVDGALGLDRVPVLRRHLAGCPACRERREQLTATRAAFRALAPESPSPGFDRRLRQRIAEDRHRLRFPSALLLRGVHLSQPVLAVLFAGALAVSLLTLWVPSRRHEPAAAPGAPVTLLRLGFDGVPGGSLPSWTASPGTKSSLVAGASGPAAELHAPAGDRRTGELRRELNARPFQGRVVQYRARVRVAGGAAGGGAQLVLRIVRPGFAAEHTSGQVSSLAWQPVEIATRIPADALRLELGVRFPAGATAWIEDPRLALPGPPLALRPKGF